MHAIDKNRNYKVSMVRRKAFAGSSLAMVERSLLSKAPPTKWAPMGTKCRALLLSRIYVFPGL